MAVAADPKNQDVYYLLGRELAAAGRKDEARKCFEQALELNAGDARAQNELGELVLGWRLVRR